MRGECLHKVKFSARHGVCGPNSNAPHRGAPPRRVRPSDWTRPIYARHLQPVLRELLDELRIVYLTGPRQAGKTTLAWLVCRELGLEYVSLDNQATLAAAQSDPHGFVRSLGTKRVVLDEFQNAPALIPAIKEASDRLEPRERGKFLLTGSADIFRSARTQEALPGHMARLELLPLSVAELAGTRRNIVDYLLAGAFTDAPAASTTREDIASLVLRGGYPELQSKSPRGKRAWYRSYMEGRLYKDFETLHAARGDYFSKLRTLAPWLAGASGNLLKYASVANDLELDDRLTKRYVEMLELMYIVRRVSAWRRGRAKRAATRMPKVHYVDTGLACHLLGLRHERQLLASPYYGGLLESLVYMECCKHAAWAEEAVDLWHFRDNRKREVDIVLERADARIIGVEVKASASVRQEDFKGLAALADFAGSVFERGVLFYGGQEALPFHSRGIRFHALPLGMLAAA